MARRKKEEQNTQKQTNKQTNNKEKQLLRARREFAYNDHLSSVDNTEIRSGMRRPLDISPIYGL